MYEDKINKTLLNTKTPRDIPQARDEGEWKWRVKYGLFHGCPVYLLLGRGRAWKAGWKVGSASKLGSFAAEFLCPFRVSCQILVADRRSGVPDGLNEVLQNKWRLKELLCFYAEPGHLDRTGIAGRARGKLLGSLDDDL